MADSPSSSTSPSSKSSPRSSSGKAKDSEIDPELVRLPRPPIPIGTVTALAVITICVTLCIRLLGDLSFSFEDDVPRQLTGLEVDSHTNEYLELTAKVDHTQGVRIVPTSSETGPILLPVVGKGGTLWILVPETPWSAEVHTDFKYEGRLTLLSDTDFEPELRAFVKKASVPRPVKLAEIRSALAQKTAQVHDAYGDPMPITPDTKVHYIGRASSKVRVRAASTDPYNSEASWNLALTAAGLQDVQVVERTPTSWTFDVAAPSGIESVRTALTNLRAASVWDIDMAKQGTWADLNLDDESINLGDPQLGFEAHKISLQVAPTIATSAYVLNTNERPSDYWYMPFLFALIVGLGLIFLTAAYRSVYPS